MGRYVDRDVAGAGIVGATVCVTDDVYGCTAAFIGDDLFDRAIFWHRHFFAVDSDLVCCGWSDATLAGRALLQ